jgi:hypothetical protein
MREQGAEFAGRVRVLQDGMQARRVEKELASKNGLRDRVLFEDKVNSVGMVESLDQARGIARGIHLSSEVDLVDVRGMYQSPKLGQVSRPIVINGTSVKGVVEDTRGEALYVTHRENLYAFDLRRTIGRALGSTGGRIKTQLTLHNFGSEAIQC